MELFYIPDVTGDQATVDGDELHHIVKVLRYKVGDEVHFTDGRGGLYRGTLTSVSKKRAIVEVGDMERKDPVPFRISLSTALTKNVKRMEWCFEKVTELGVDAIIPLVCHRSERSKLPVNRMRKIIISAMKQSERVYLPELKAPMELEEVFKDRRSAVGHRYMAYRGPESVELCGHYSPGQDVTILIGPEGDFTSEELELAKAEGFVPLSLGPKRLRTETAGVAVVAVLQALNLRV